jgi:hypothetical protein
MSEIAEPQILRSAQDDNFLLQLRIVSRNHESE